jgi:hypothetical protein
LIHLQYIIDNISELLIILVVDEQVLQLGHLLFGFEFGLESFEADLQNTF